MRRLLSVIAVFGLTCAGFVTSAGPAGAVIGGSEIPASALAPGGAYEWLARLENAAGETDCSGSLVAPEWVLTAAHCVDGAVAQIRLGLDAPVAFDPDRTVAYPAFDINHPSQGGDAALFHLATPSTRRPVGFGPSAGDVAVGDTVTVAGWGRTSVGFTGDFPPMPRVGSATVADPTGYGSADALIVTTAGAMTCEGDSGGPMLRAGRLIGVTSFGPYGCGLFSASTRLAPLKAWIQSIAGVGDQPPIANAVSVTVARNRATFINRSAESPQGEPLAFSIVTPPAHGTLALCATAGPSCRYTPNAGFTGTDSFEWAVSDGIHTPVTATETIEVRTNVPPIGASANVTTSAGVGVDLPIDATDADGDPLQFHLVSTPVFGELSGSCGATCAMTYVPTPGVVGTEMVAWTVSDGFATSGPYLVTIHVVPAAPLTVTPIDAPSDAAALAQSIAGSDPVSGATYTGDLRAAGRFTGGDAAFGVASGVVLASGKVADVPGTSTQFASTTFGGAGTDLLAGPGQTTSDAAVLEYDTVPSGDHLSFRYVFAGDEYYDAQAFTPYDDAAVVQVDGTPCALPGGGTPSSLSINHGITDIDGTPVSGPVHPDLFVANGGFAAGGRPTSYNGMSKVLTCTATVTPGVPVHVAIAVADRGAPSDGTVDSAILVEAASPDVVLANAAPLAISIPPVTVAGHQGITKFKVDVTNQSADPIDITDSMLVAGAAVRGFSSALPITALAPVARTLAPGAVTTVVMAWPHGDGITIGTDYELSVCAALGGMYECATRPVTTTYADSATATTMAPVATTNATARVAVRVTDVGSTPSTIRPTDVSIRVEVNGAPVAASVVNSPLSTRKLLRPGRATRFGYAVTLPTLAIGDVVTVIATVNDLGDPNAADNVSIATRTVTR